MENSRGHKMIETMLSKPNKKPDFAAELKSLLSNSVLTRAKAFVPEFIATTDKILSDPNNHRMDIVIRDQANIFNETELEFETEQVPGTINMVSYSTDNLLGYRSWHLRCTW